MDIDITNINEMMNNPDFEEAWQSSLDAVEPTEEDLNEATPQYQYVNGIARVKQIAILLGVFFHAVHGEKCMAIIAPQEDSDQRLFEETKISFHLNQN